MDEPKTKTVVVERNKATIETQVRVVPAASCRPVAELPGRVSYACPACHRRMVGHIGGEPAKCRCGAASVVE